MEPAVVLVSGAPGAGKTTLAGPVSRLLGLPLLAKDVIKERPVATLSPPPPSDYHPLTWSRIVGGAAMEVLWALARQPVTVMIEANFRPRSSIERERLIALQRPVIEVHCWCPMGRGELVTVDTSGRVHVARVATQVRALLTGTAG